MRQAYMTWSASKAKHYGGGQGGVGVIDRVGLITRVKPAITRYVDFLFKNILPLLARRPYSISFQLIFNLIWGYLLNTHAC